MSILGQFQFRRDTAANWTSVNPILLDGELGIESDTDKFKIGDGTTTWNGLMYGGIKGDTGAESTVPGPQGDKGWSPVLANVADGERRVLRLIDWTGGAGTKPAVPTDNYIGPTGFTDLANATDIRGATGAAGATPNSFTSIAVSGQTTIAADSPTDTLTLAAGSGITITTDEANDTVTFASSINVPNAFTNFLIGTSPTPTSLTPDLAADTLTINAGSGISLTADAGTDTFTITNAAPDQTVSLANGTGISVTGTYPSFTVSNTGVTSVNGQTGAITIPVGTAVTRTSATASASTALTTIQSYPVATGEITAGSEYEFYASLRVINTTTATNAVITLSVGATNVLVLTQAIGATAAAAPGAAVDVYGRITFYSATAAEATIRASKQAAVAFDAVTNTSASVTVAAATATTIDLKFNTSGATSTFIARQATIKRVK